MAAACAPVRNSNGVQVITHPDGPLYVGDRVSFEVLLPETGRDNNETVEVNFEGRAIGSASLSPFGIGRRDEAALWWAWETEGLKPGKYTLTFTRSGSNASWNETFSLLPESQVPHPGLQAHWADSITDCCILHYITGTDAARDIDQLTREAQQQSDDVARLMDHHVNSKIDLTMMSRVIGQGGFTTSSIYVSYLDGNYMGNEIPIIFHHEFIHLYDGDIGGGYRPSILEEGLAVYLSGGHFKIEPLEARAAALLDLGKYIPLEKLADDFYQEQHEIGYLEGATLVKYLVDKYGEAAFYGFFRQIPAPQNQRDSEVIDQALREHFNISFTELETDYLAGLKAQSFSADARTDLRLTISFFDTVRRYQKSLDPSAYFLTAWLPDGAVMRQRGIVADFLRRPLWTSNRLVEFLLVRGQAQLFSGNYAAAELSINWVNRLLDLLGG